MKLTASTLLSLAFGASASAVAPRSNIESRSLDVVMRVMTSVYEHMGVLDNAVSNYYGLQDVEPLKKAGSEMVSTVKSSDAEVVVMTPVTLQEAIQFQPLSDKLNARGEQFIKDVESKISTFGADGVCPHALDMVTQIGTNVVKLMTDVAAKFPTGGQGQSNQGIIQHFSKLFDDAIAKLKACSDAGAPRPSGQEGNWVQVTIVQTATVDCESTTVPVAVATYPAAVVTGKPVTPAPAAPTTYYPRPANGTVGAYPPAATSTKPYVVVAGASSHSVAAGAIAIMAAAYFL